MKSIKAMLAILALGFSLNSFALSDEEYMEFTEALGSGNMKVVKKHIEADPKLVNEKFFAWEPLQMAASKGHLNLVKYLVEKGADKDYVHPASQNTAFHMAAFTYKKDLIQYLADQGADVNKKLKGGVSLVRYFRDLKQTEMAAYMESLGVKDDGCQEEKCF
jgi:uncharacterized protein